MVRSQGLWKVFSITLITCICWRGEESTIDVEENIELLVRGWISSCSSSLQTLWRQQLEWTSTSKFWNQKRIWIWSLKILILLSNSSSCSSQSTKLRHQTEKPDASHAVTSRKVPSTEGHQGMDFSEQLSSGVEQCCCDTWQSTGILGRRSLNPGVGFSCPLYC